MKERNKRVLVGMSGGIDSTATCLMLQERGYEIVGVTMSRKTPESWLRKWGLNIMWRMSVSLSKRRS